MAGLFIGMSQVLKQLTFAYVYTYFQRFGVHKKGSFDTSLSPYCPQRNCPCILNLKNTHGNTHGSPLKCPVHITIVYSMSQIIELYHNIV